MSLSLCPLSSVFFYFDISPHFSPPNGLERSQNSPWRFNHCAVNVMVLKEINSKALSTMYVSVLKAANSVCIHNGLEMRPVNACSGQVHCFLDTGMASMEVCHNIVSAGQWNDHSFALGQDVTVNGEFIMEAPVKSCCSGDTTLSVGPTIQGESVHH